MGTANSVSGAVTKNKVKRFTRPRAWRLQSKDEQCFHAQGVDNEDYEVKIAHVLAPCIQWVGRMVSSEHFERHWMLASVFIPLSRVEEGGFKIDCSPCGHHCSSRTARSRQDVRWKYAFKSLQYSDQGSGPIGRFQKLPAEMKETYLERKEMTDESKKDIKGLP